MCKAKVAVCSEMRTKHSTQNEHHIEFLNVKPGVLEFFFDIILPIALWPWDRLSL